jgi:cellulose biosynthesis protein BcsQ
MTAYAFWNNKGGVGKSFLCFVAASEYAYRHPDTDVYVIDLCPQANTSETLFGGYGKSAEMMKKLLDENPRRSVAGYLETRLSSPFRMIDDVRPILVIRRSLTQLYQLTST